ncbi:cytochrome P450 [Mycena sanguinolenta]|nr:cytochrome P450 [Mycena sanguinolenta]
MFPFDLPLAGAIPVALGLVLYGLYLRGNHSRLPLPPGPKKRPLVGNVWDIPPTRPWETYMAWSKDYNTDILHLDLAGTSLIVLTSSKAAEDLLDKRSAIYSDRPRLPMLSELMGWDFNTAMMKYGKDWRAHRRLFNQKFTSKASAQYQPQQLAASHELLRRFLRAPDDFMDHFRRWATEIIMSIAYGIDLLPNDDPYVGMAYEAVEGLSHAGVPGRYLVDSLPILKYVPSWFPGAKFKREAKKWRKHSQRLADSPLEETKRQMELGIARPSFAADSLNALKDLEDKYYTENIVRGAAGTMFVGGADTTVSALGSFVLGMLANPDAQKRAQSEIDSVTQGKCLPDFADLEAMPYVTAVVKETLRWKNVGPMAVPHFLTAEDEYKGYRIPANSIVIGNTWAILHDEAVYPDPYAFKPERYLREDGTLNPAMPHPEAAFGYGRRLCPGRHMANASLLITIASVLATFDITKALDDNGQVIEPSYEFDSGFINTPLPFKCSILPRSKHAADLIQSAGQA